MSEPDKEYFNSSGIGFERIACRYKFLLRELYAFINVKGIAQSVIVDHKSLKKAILDYFVDIAGIKKFHVIERVNFEKIYGYMAYWLLRRKPIQVIRPFPGSEFINELWAAAYIISKILSEKQLDGKKCAKNATFSKFQSLLFYNLQYRPITQQSLELMIEAFFCGCDFSK
jgi:hypothetical protein